MIAVYRASSNRGNTVEQEIEHLKKLAEETGGTALKFRLGDRMSKNVDSRPGRTEALIPKVREAFGPEFTLYAGSNSSYDVENAIRIGRLMEEHDYGFFEEPCPSSMISCSTLSVRIIGRTSSELLVSSVTRSRCSR